MQIPKRAWAPKLRLECQELEPISQRPTCEPLPPFVAIHCLDSRELDPGIMKPWDQLSLNGSPAFALAPVASGRFVQGSGVGFWSATRSPLALPMPARAAGLRLAGPRRCAAARLGIEPSLSGRLEVRNLRLMGRRSPGNRERLEAGERGPVGVTHIPTEVGKRICTGLSARAALRLVLRQSDGQWLGARL
jgi:hypothetical protein